MKTFLLLMIVTVSLGCSHSIHLVHSGGFDSKIVTKGKHVVGYAEQHVILGVSFNTNYVNEAYQFLQANCRDGEISGVTTQYSTSHGFFSWTNKVLMQGKCLKPGVDKVVFRKK